MDRVPFPEVVTLLPQLTDLVAARQDDLQQISYHLETEKVDIYYTKYEAGIATDFHSHATANFGVVTEGRCTLIMDDREQSIGVGEWYYIPAHKMHATRIDEDTVEVGFRLKENT